MVTPDNFQMIDVKKIIYDKKMAIIYNPNSGSRNDIRVKIGDVL